MTCNSPSSSYVFKPGDDLTWLGQIKIPGVVDYSGYVLNAQIRLASLTDGSPGALLATPTFVGPDIAGDITMSVARAVTVLWPEHSILILDVVSTAPGGLKTTSPSVTFATGTRVTEIAP